MTDYNAYVIGLTEQLKAVLDKALLVAYNHHIKANEDNDARAVMLVRDTIANQYQMSESGGITLQTVADALKGK